MFKQRFFIRLDDASDYMDERKWERMEQILDKYGIKPIFGIIPSNQDKELRSKYEKNDFFWEQVKSWIDKGWIPAMHGFEHRYETNEGGINPVNNKSEFAGLSLWAQQLKIRAGWKELLKRGIQPDVFFAPAHTFDRNTLEAIRKETTIRVISDTPAWDVYNRWGFLFIPQQSGKVRNLPLKTITFCYHPNSMKEQDFLRLESFVGKNRRWFVEVKSIRSKRKMKVIDKIIYNSYFALIKIRRLSK